MRYCRGIGPLGTTYTTYDNDNTNACFELNYNRLCHPFAINLI